MYENIMFDVSKTILQSIGLPYVPTCRSVRPAGCGTLAGLQVYINTGLHSKGRSKSASRPSRKARKPRYEAEYDHIDIALHRVRRRSVKVIRH